MATATAAAAVTAASLAGRRWAAGGAAAARGRAAAAGRARRPLLLGACSPHARWLSSSSAPPPEEARRPSQPSTTRSAQPLDPTLPSHGPPTLWTRFVKFAYKYLGNSVYPTKADICNCGMDAGVQIPRPDLVKREGIAFNSREWRMQVYGASLYWHMATMPTEAQKDADPDLLRGRDVLEVACMRGGGAHYLAEVAGPHRYVATDNVQEHIDLCKTLHTPCSNLEFSLCDAHELATTFPAEEFDFVICIQASATFANLREFLRGAHHVLRPGGRIMMCDCLHRDSLKVILDTSEELGLVVDVEKDISRAVHAVGLCQVPFGLAYLRFVLRKT